MAVYKFSRERVAERSFMNILKSLVRDNDFSSHCASTGDVKTG